MRGSCNFRIVCSRLDNNSPIARVVKITCEYMLTGGIHLSEREHFSITIEANQPVFYNIFTSVKKTFFAIWRIRIIGEAQVHVPTEPRSSVIMTPCPGIVLKSMAQHWDAERNAFGIILWRGPCFPANTLERLEQKNAQCSSSIINIANGIPLMALETFRNFMENLKDMENVLQARLLAFLHGSGGLISFVP